jgi:hypothetical protein
LIYFSEITKLPATLTTSASKTKPMYSFTPNKRSLLMNQGMMNTIVSAVVGGIVGAAVVFFASGTSQKSAEITQDGIPTKLVLEELQVASLVITDHAVLRNKAGKDELLLKDGSILAENVILGKKFIGTQFQGHAFVANRLFTTPDDLIRTPMNQWRFYAEIGASEQAGGEIVVRSVTGPAMIDKPTTAGVLARLGFDTDGRPQMFAIHNPDRRPLPITSELTDLQRQMLSGTAPGMPSGPGNFNSDSATTPMGVGAGYVPPATVATPQSGIYQ